MKAGLPPAVPGSPRGLPAVLGYALARIAGDVAGKLALEGRRQREAAQPLHFGAGADQRPVRFAGGAIHDEARAGQRLEQRGDCAVSIVIMRPYGAAAQATYPDRICFLIGLRSLVFPAAWPVGNVQSGRSR
jgi:hypothetical protein